MTHSSTESHSETGSELAAHRLVSGDGTIEVQFLWRVDRYIHRVTRVGDRTPWAESHDGDASHDWPASPPLQQLSRETIDGRDVLLGIGCAGRAHWSISVEASASELRFELACRHRAAAEFLGSSYRVTHWLDLVAEPGSIVTRHHAANAVTITPATVKPSGTTCWSYVISMLE